MVTGDGKVENSISTLMFWFFDIKKRITHEKAKVKGKNQFRDGFSIDFLPQLEHENHVCF